MLQQTVRRITNEIFRVKGLINKTGFDMVINNYKTYNPYLGMFITKMDIHGGKKFT